LVAAEYEVFALTRRPAINDRHQGTADDSRRCVNPMGSVLRTRLDDASSSIRF
jgi:hypothetical protein